MLNEFSRSELLLGYEGIQKLKKATVAVFGVGGVGSYVVEALARSGVGNIVLFDKDTVSLTNINRQLIAAHSTIGEAKVFIERARILDINPQANVVCHQVFYGADNASEYPLDKYDYIVDAMDTVSSKLLLAELASQLKVPIISCMGTGNKLDPAGFEVTDIKKTKVCPLAKVMRRELKKRGIYDLKVVYSNETPISIDCDTEQESKGTAGRPAPGSVSFVPPVAGMILAGEVIKSLI